MRKHLTADGDLPRDGQYVLAHVNYDNWGDDDDPVGHRYYKVVKFVRGISIAERAALPDNTDRRKTTVTGADEAGNNRRPYCWEEFGPGSFFGQDVDCWYDLSELY